MKMSEFLNVDLEEEQKRWNVQYKIYEKTGIFNDFPKWKFRGRAEHMKTFEKYNDTEIIAGFDNGTLKIVLLRGCKKYFAFIYLKLPKQFGIELNYNIQRVEIRPTVKYFEKYKDKVQFFDREKYIKLINHMIEKEVIDNL